VWHFKNILITKFQVASLRWIGHYLPQIFYEVINKCSAMDHLKLVISPLVAHDVASNCKVVAKSSKVQLSVAFYGKASRFMNMGQDQF